MGNPYPSYINVQDFLNHDVGGRTNLQLFEPGTAAIYGYDGDVTDDWKILNLATTTANSVITPGQGFFVSADAAWVAGFDMQFTPAMQTGATGTPSEDDDFIAGRQGGLVYVTINISNGMGGTFNTDVYFNEFASLGFDLGFDAELFTVPTDFALYSLLVVDDAPNPGNPIALQAVNPDDLANVVIPLGVNAPQGEQITFSISVNELPPTTDVYLDDTVANVSTLLNSGDYVLTPTTQLFADGRFFLRIEDDTLSADENDLGESITILSLTGSKEIAVSGQLQNNTIATLYDIQGRKVLSKGLDSSLNQNRIDVSSLSSGIYVINVENNGQQKSQKVIIK
ncbi:MAG: T9SS type A sorting domain-containing protein [Psychroserpens sp.]|nr:T9SS type A sorting domain-containing protein [Psychroserpens sp.]